MRFFMLCCHEFFLKKLIETTVLPFLSNASVLRSIRVIRTFRTLRSINILTGLQIVVQTIIDSIPGNYVLIFVVTVLFF